MLYRIIHTQSCLKIYPLFLAQCQQMQPDLTCQTHSQIHPGILCFFIRADGLCLSPYLALTGSTDCRKLLKKDRVHWAWPLLAPWLTFNLVLLFFAQEEAPQPPDTTLNCSDRNKKCFRPDRTDRPTLVESKKQLPSKAAGTSDRSIGEDRGLLHTVGSAMGRVRRHLAHPCLPRAPAPGSKESSRSSPKCQ